MAERVRIQKAIAHAGLMSRRAAEDAIVDGRVRLNDADVVLGDRVDIEKDLLTLDGVPVTVDPTRETHLLYKPIGVISTASDPQHRTTVTDLVPSERRIYPVGRLDADSEGLILLSNDGELTNRVTHPSFGVTKTYLVVVRGQVSGGDVRRLKTGIDLEDGKAQAARSHLVDAHRDRSMVELVMVEGRNREVRRMFETLGHDVESLVRTAIGGLRDTSMKSGDSRRLSATEIRRIFDT